jgi:MULE transposase domain
VAAERFPTAWEEFFKQLDGEPTFITCDRDDAMLNAIAAHWPNAKVYPCVSHVRANGQSASAPSSGRSGT